MQLVDTIRGIVETEQAESDRSLENTIHILGIGFGGGAIVSGVVVQNIDKINIPLISAKNPPNPFYASLLLSFLATLFFIAGSRESAFTDLPTSLLLGYCGVHKS
jgi:hypothetical protein